MPASTSRTLGVAAATALIVGALGGWTASYASTAATADEASYGC
jgi:hypothetical protein